MSAPDWLAGLLDQVRAEARAAATEQVRAELLRARAATTSGPRLLSLAALGKRYGIGRKQAEQMIAAGRLPSVERRARGGRMGTFVAVEDAEVVLAGRARQ